MHLSPYNSLQVHQPSWTFYFLAPSICEMELNWPVSKGSPSSDVLGSDKLMVISLTGRLSFPRAGENWSGVRLGSNCKGEQHVLRAQCLKAESRCPSSTPSPFGTLAGLLPQYPPALAPSLLLSVFQEVQKGSSQGPWEDWCFQERGSDLGWGSGSSCFFLSLFHLKCLLPYLPPLSALEGAWSVVVRC